MDSLINYARTLPRQRPRPAAQVEPHRPEAMFIACSDARVSPALLTGARPGQILELRTVGNVVPPYRPGRCCSEAATLSYALEVLAVTDIVVCGHSHCAAVGIMRRGGLTTSTFDTWWWLTRTKGRARPAPAPATPSEVSHLHAQLDKLRSYPAIKRRLAQGRLRLHGWYYDLSTGGVSTLDPDDNSLGPL
ncbi:carbonic anhydrase [Nonomuraea sp. NPDC049784]|uniref:carbonic anhydrase n=1 Tax=Nonomuraea sp. NPDC049784 TaxID=3154361 RepID=UPI0033C2974F